MNELLEWALFYAQEKKCYVFPVREIARAYIGKYGKPEVAKVKEPYTSEGFLNASIDPATIRGWWSKYPEAGIGVSCEHSNLIALDIDVKSGVNGFDSYMSLGISDENALHASSPSGGMHIIFSGKMFSQANIKKGVDVRSIGAYFIAPPSFIYVDGKKKYYSTDEDWRLISPVNPPASFFEKIKTLKQRGEIKERKIIDEKIEVTIEKAKKALDSLPQEYCDEYFMWVNIGMSLHSLGEVGFDLWNEWSKKSPKYDYDACRKRWDKFEPRSISINSLFFYAKEAQNNG